MEIKVIKNPIHRKELVQIARDGFGDFIKAVVDVQKEIMAIGGELHADEEVLLTEQEESKREHTWGINIYPEKSDDECIEFDSMINLKPHYGNRSRNVESLDTQEKIRKIVRALITE